MIFMKGFLDVVESVNHLQKNTAGLTYDKPTLLIEKSHCFLVTKYNHTKFLDKQELLDYIAQFYSLRQSILDQELETLKSSEPQSFVGGVESDALLLKLYPADQVLHYFDFREKSWLYLHLVTLTSLGIADTRYRRRRGRRFRVT